MQFCERFFFHLSHLCGASCYIRLLFRAVAAAPAWLLGLLRLAGSSVVLLALIVRSARCAEHELLAAHGWRAGWHKGRFCAAASTCVGWEKFWQLKTR